MAALRRPDGCCIETPPAQEPAPSAAKNQSHANRGRTLAMQEFTVVAQCKLEALRRGPAGPEDHSHFDSFAIGIPRAAVPIP
jgi:hypothetical protein